MDDFAEVNVSRSTVADSDLDNDNWWSPSGASTGENPYGRSPLTIGTSSAVKLTSVLVRNKDGSETTVTLAFKVKRSGSDAFEEVKNPKDQSNTFEVTPGENFPLPDGMTPLDEIEVYVVGTGPASDLSVIPFGCEAPGEYTIEL